MTVSSEAKLSKAEQAYHHLRENIRTRVYDPGFRLVLSSIAAELEISTVPVREAIRQLEAEGMVTYETNVGARVSNLNRQAYFETMETVAILESRATGLSVPYLEASDIAHAKDCNDQMRALLDDFSPETFTELNKKFHQALFKKCPNTRLTDLVFAEWERLDVFRVSTFRYIPNRAADSVKEHSQIVSLIEAGAAPGYVEQVAGAHRMATSDSYRQQLNLETKTSSVDDAHTPEKETINDR